MFASTAKHLLLSEFDEQIYKGEVSVHIFSLKTGNGAVKGEVSTFVKLCELTPPNIEGRRVDQMD